MAQKKIEGERKRKSYAPDGQRGQKMMSFRLDNENQDWIMQQPNRGRYINELIAADRKRTSVMKEDPEENPEEDENPDTWLP